MVDRKVTDTNAAKTLKTHDDDDELSPDIQEFLMANRAKVMKFFNDMMSPEQNAVWQKGIEPFGLSDEFKACALVMFEDAVDAKVAQVIDAVEDQYETTLARLIQEREQLLDYIERECPLDEADAHKSEKSDVSL